MSEFDVIVIGSGMGGMTTAAALSRLEHKVLVLEQAQTIGGLTHAFSREGFTWDVGLLHGEVPGAGPARRLSRAWYPARNGGIHRPRERRVLRRRNDTPRRMLSEALAARTPVPGLFLSGQDVMTPGIAGALAGGMLGAAAIDPRVYRKFIW